MGSTLAYHGGNLQEAESLFGRPPDGWLDLSTGINPTPYPDTTLSGSAWYRLPQADAHDTLIAAARRHYNVPEDTDIVAAPGSQAILQLLPAILRDRRVAVLGPTYEEHVTLWTAHGHKVETVTALSAVDRPDIVVLVNPNNPDGRVIAPNVLLEIARSLPKPDGLLIVDEAFTDLEPALAISPKLTDSPILSIRSFGKFFGLPGLRLGFAAGAASVVAALRDRLGPWAVSGPALEIGARALADTAWIERTRQELMKRAGILDESLSHADMTVIGGTALFRLVQVNDASKTFKRLGESGIFVRRFPDRPDWLRFGVPGTDDAMKRLQHALS